MPHATVWRETLHHHRAGSQPRHARCGAAVSGDQAGPEAVPESGPKCAPANHRAAKTAAIKSGGVKTASTKATTTHATEATAHAATTHATAHAAAKAPAVTPATPARRHNIGGKHSKCCNRQQHDHDFTEHD
jgi:hypothetical protein